MIFGDRISESPRVPSPWTAVAGAAQAGASGASSRSRRGHAQTCCKRLPSSESNSSSARSTPPLRAIARTKKAGLLAGEKSPLSGSTLLADHGEAMASARDTSLEDEQSDSVSTPPTDDSDNDGFFCLDVDLDVSKMSLNESTTQTADASMATEASVAGTLDATHAIRHLAPEPDVRGNLEYKLRILPHTRHRYDRLLTQLKWRMLQGGGQCTYEIGVLDDGDCIGICSREMHGSLRVLLSMASDLDAAVSIHRAFQVHETAGKDGIADLQMVALAPQVARTLLVESSEPASDLCWCGVSAMHLQEMLSFMPLFEAAKLHVDNDLSRPMDRQKGSAAGAEEQVCEQSRPDDRLCPSSSDDAPAGFFSFEADDDGTDAPADELGHDDDDGDGVTFSLSLDEQATRLGMGYQRKLTEPRKKCRYNVQSAQQRQRCAVEEARAVQHSPSGPDVERSGCRDAAVQGPAHPAHAAIAATTPHCTRLILEVSISRILGTDAFIDYASL